MIIRSILFQFFLLLVIACNGSPLLAQDWVRNMFEETEHDFGTVPRGADASFEFKLSNKYEEDVHIAAVRSSCGCTIPRIGTADLKTYQKGTIICEFNTKSFIGQKSAVVTVVFTKPYYGEMQLNVKGNIRSDITTEPGIIEFGEVERGSEKETQVKISYAGRNQWEITDVRSENQNLGVTLQREQGTGRVAYVMNVRLKDSAPAGEFQDQIVLVTNDPQFNLVTVPVRGQILPPLVMPVSVDLGSVKAGEKIKSRVVVKSKDEFEIKNIVCSDERFTFSMPDGKKRAHIIQFEFDTGDVEGAFRETLKVESDLASEGTAVTTISGNVIK